MLPEPCTGVRTRAPGRQGKSKNSKYTEQQRFLENGDAQDLENRVEVQGCPAFSSSTMGQ
jgi:hypothetical protein